MAEEIQGHVKYIRVRQADGSFTDAMLIAVSPYNVDFEDGTNLVEKLEEKAEKRYYGDTSINVGRIPGTDTGTNSIAVGENVTAKGNQSVSLGISTSAENEAATALGKDTKAVGKYSVAQGESTYAGGYASVAEGYQSSATGKYSHAQGEAALATGEDSFASGYNTVANGKKATALGEGTIATGNNSLVHGKYNIEDTENKYAEIIGNGLDDENRSDIYTLDWQGNAIFKGNVSAERFDGRAYYDAKGNEITDYIIKITSNKNKLEYTTGAGKKTQIELMGFSEKTTQYYSWTNENPGVINNSNKEICVMAYGGAISESEKPGAIFMAQLLINASPTKDTLTLEFELKIDGNLINPNWKPTEILTKGPHIITLMYPLDELEVNHTHKFQLGAKCLEENATVNYDIGDIKCVLYGIGFPGGGGEPLEEDISYLRHFVYRNLSEINIFWNDYNTLYNVKDYNDHISFQTISDFDNFNYNGILSYKGATMYYTYNNLYRNLNLYSNSNKYYFNKNCSKMFLYYYSDYYNNAQIYSSTGNILKKRMYHNYIYLFQNIEYGNNSPIIFYENAFDLVEDLSMFIGYFEDSDNVGKSYIGREQDAPDSYWIRLRYSFVLPKKMPNVVNMYRSFYYGNLNGNPIETPKVINMAYTYYNCYNIKGNPTCGKETNNMAYTYYYCMNLTGSPVCSFNTDNMAYTYYCCNNLTGSPVCGENTYNMRGAYSNCYRLTGNPVCSLKTDDLTNAYYNCQNLTGAPVSSDYTTDMNFTYYHCYNIKGSPLVGNSVKSLCYTYSDCYNITGTGILGPLVKNIECSYDGCINLSYPDMNESNWTYIINANHTYANCVNLLACYCGNQVKTMNNTYSYCPKITGIAAVGPAVENMLFTYANSGISKPVVHDNLKNMIYTYQNTKVSVPLCGNYVFNFSGCYSACPQIKTAVCGPEVTDFSYTYQSCKGLTTAVVGPKVTRMDSTYASCTSLKKPVFEYPDCLLSMNRTYKDCAILDTAACGNNVKYMIETYYNCPKIKTAVCGPKVTDMDGTYISCSGLTTLNCGNKVINMTNTYRGTYFKQVVEPVCGPEVVTMTNTYLGCRNINQAVCGEKVKYMNATYYKSSVKYAACGDNVLTLGYIVDRIHNHTYILGTYANCSSLIQSACGNNVTNMSYAYYNCGNLKNFVSGPKVTNMYATYADCTSYIYKGNVYHTYDFSPTYNAFICFPIDMSKPVGYQDIVNEADIACDFACGDNVWTMNYTYSNLKAPAYRAFNLATWSERYDQDGITTYECIDSGIQISLLKGNISAPVIGNNVYCAVHAYYNYMKGYYGGETYMRYNGYASINITNCFYGRKSWSPLLNIYVAEGSRMNNAFYFCTKDNSPFGGIPKWEIYEEENYYYTPKYNTRIYYCNEDELGRTYHGEELINEPTCEEEGKYYKYYTDKDGNEGIKIRYIPALGHDIDEVTQTCKRCGKQLKANVWIHKKDAGSLPNHFMAINEEGTEFRPILFNEEDPTDTQGCSAQDKWEIICDRDIEYTFKIEATDYYHLTSRLKASKFYIALDGKRLVGNETESYVFITPLSLEETYQDGIPLPSEITIKLTKGSHTLLARYAMTLGMTAEHLPNLKLTLPKLNINNTLVEKIENIAATCLEPKYEVWSTSDGNIANIAIGEALGHDYSETKICKRCGYRKIGWVLDGAYNFNSDSPLDTNYEPPLEVKSNIEDDVWVFDYANYINNSISINTSQSRFSIDVPVEQETSKYEISYVVPTGNSDSLRVRIDNQEIIPSSSMRKGKCTCTLTAGHHTCHVYFAKQQNYQSLELKLPDLNREFTKIIVISEATCTKSGLSNYYYIDDTGKEVEKEAITPALGHNIDKETCICSRCGAYLPTSIEIQNEGEYTFVPNTTKTIWTSNNTGIGGSMATIILKVSGYSSLHWRVSSERNYDKLSILINNVETNVKDISGENNGTLQLDASKDTIITATYSKDPTGNTNEDIGELTFIQ